MTLDKKYRILICPYEIGGQMQLMAQELRRRGYYATSASYSQSWLGYVNDISIDLRTVGRIRRLFRRILFMLWAAEQYDIFHFFYGSSLLEPKWFPHPDVRILKRLGKRIFVHFRGSDIVDAAYYDYLHNKVAGASTPEPAISRPDQLRSLNTWRRFADRMLVSGPGLLRIVPEAELIQQVIDPEYWVPSGSPEKHSSGVPLRIVHAPTSRHIKGTEFVERSVDELKRQGHLLELLLVENKPASEVKAIYESADIAIDQLLYGWHGKFSVELMALGKPVICYVDSQLAQFRPELPIVNAVPGDLTEKLRELVIDARKREDLGIRGRSYVRKYHDVRGIIDDCLRIYAESY